MVILFFKVNGRSLKRIESDKVRSDSFLEILGRSLKRIESGNNHNPSHTRETYGRSLKRIERLYCLGIVEKSDANVDL